MAGKSILNLKQFMLRLEVLKLYRDIHRCVRKIPDERYRTDMANWARHDFKKHMNLTDEMAIRMMLTKGRMSLRELEQAMGNAKWFLKIA